MPVRGRRRELACPPVSGFSWGDEREQDFGADVLLVQETPAVIDFVQGVLDTVPCRSA